MTSANNHVRSFRAKTYDQASHHRSFPEGELAGEDGAAAS